LSNESGAENRIRSESPHHAPLLPDAEIRDGGKDSLPKPNTSASAGRHRHHVAGGDQAGSDFRPDRERLAVPSAPARLHSRQEISARPTRKTAICTNRSPGCGRGRKGRIRAQDEDSQADERDGQAEADAELD
jgi:hypothetical protein